MKTLLGTLIVTINLALSTNAIAEIKTYQSTDNTGLNKQERIEAVEGYLIELSKSLKSMESKLDENAKKMSDLDHVVKAMAAADKEAAEKMTKEKLGEKKKTPETAEAKEVTEVEKLKADILVLKNEDIEKLKVQFEEMNDTVKAIQSSLRDRSKSTSAKK